MNYVPLSTTKIPIRVKNDTNHLCSYKRTKNIYGNSVLRCCYCGKYKRSTMNSLCNDKFYKLDTGKVNIVRRKDHTLVLDFKTKEEEEKEKEKNKIVVKKDYKLLWKEAIKYSLRLVKYTRLIKVYKEYRYPKIKSENKEQPCKEQPCKVYIPFQRPKGDRNYYSKTKTWLIKSPYEITSDFVTVIPIKKRRK